MMLKKIASLVLAIALVPVAAFSASAATAAPVIKVAYNQKQIAFPDQNPVMRDNRTLVPIRPIAESLGFDVNWNEKTRTVTINKGNDNVRLVVSQKIAKKNGQTINLDVPAQIINKRTMVPVRFIAEALSYDVNWDQKSQTVLIADKSQTVQPDQPKGDTQNPSSPANGGQSTTTAQFVDKSSIEALYANFMGLGIYSLTGKTDPSADLHVKLEDKTYEVEVKSDGTFKFELMDKISTDEYKLTATKNGETQVLDGKFTPAQ